MKPLSTDHTIMVSDSRTLAGISDGSVDLVITSPPYPMIEMWDELFGRLDPQVSELLGGDEETALGAYESMHLQLDRVWKECYRVLRRGGSMCVNIGDATRTVGGRFRLYPNHARVIDACHHLGMESLPLILWRKQTNAPNKFMGSGMYPPGAYVTLEHEYILVFRKDGKRLFPGQAERLNRRESAYFWEERNQWFSDVWDFKGSRQSYDGATGRDRSGAFPLELAFRIVSMFSVKGDVVLDPFVGTGTTLIAAAMSGRNSVGIEIDEQLAHTAALRLANSEEMMRSYQRSRLERHRQFCEERQLAGKPCAYRNAYHDFPVVTRQETELRIELVRSTGPKNERAGAIRIPVEYGGGSELRETDEPPTDRNGSG